MEAKKKRAWIIIVNIVLVAVAFLLVFLFALRVRGIHLSPDAANMHIGETLRVTADILPAHAVEQRLEYTSDNEDVAMVDAGGMVTAFAPGTAVITATATDGSGTAGSMWVQVDAYADGGITVLAPYPEITTGQTMQLGVRIVPDEGQPVEWSINNPAIARVNQTGQLYALGPGSVTVRATLESEQYDETSISILAVEQASTPSATPVPAAQAEESTTVMLVGDLMCLYSQRTAATMADGFDFSGSFSQVREVFSRADLVVGSLKTNVADSFPYTTKYAEGDVPVLNAPKEYLDALKAAGIDVLTTANDHCCDTGAEGIRETISAIEAAGLQQTGTFAEPEQPRYTICNVGGIRLGIVAYCESFNQRQGLLAEDERAFMINEFSATRARKDIAAAKDAGAKLVLAYMHWGTENTSAVSDTQREYAQALADAGADVIAGTHPQVLQQAAYISAQDGRRVLCMYSLGNFVSSLDKQVNNDTVIVQLELTQTGESVRLSSATYIPCRVFTEYDDAAYVVVPIWDGGSQAVQRISGAIGDAVSFQLENKGESEWESGSYMYQED